MSSAVIVPPSDLQDKVVKDFEKILLNYFTGKFDLALAFNSDRVVTCQNNSAGYPLKDFDVASGRQIPGGPDVVTDELGNVVVLGSGAHSFTVLG